MKKLISKKWYWIVGIIALILITYVILWLSIYFGCKACLWNIEKYWFPFPACICVE
jgi:hypothetical protein